ncbi:BMP family ABC transporter substrate-binding protein [Athalassotoga saccharophila]|uniref:BMP family ABC transporter substrate-binding protein n=1 Tax=Athalassotoga saccharophila TaxID=1441386 RepID=UPI0013799F56|nr:BMP family ABC transporter substrate-binding protein [Athalassotoga saccharophila]BBJ27253.1 ABC transporter, substrate-binding protein [Athalassotoga saccharophila]
MKSKFLFVLLLVGIFTLSLAAPLKIAFIFVGPINDNGWTQAHYDGGVLAIQKAFGNQVQIKYIENVPEGSQSLSVLRALASQGYKLIYATSFGYMDQVIQAAKEFPNTIFEMCSGYATSTNLGEYFGAMEEARYLSGLIAGSMTKTNKIGYVAAYPTPEVVRGIDAFTLGVRSVNPYATVQVVWTYTWYDPPTEKEAALSLINAGCDVLAQHQDSPATIQAAEEKGVYAIGYDSPNMGQFGPHSYLTAPIWNWAAFYVPNVKSVLDGTWKPTFYYGNMADGLVELAPMSNLVPPQVQKLVNAMENEIKSGNFDPFEGPIYDQSGKLMIPAGQRATLDQLLSIQWFVQGVIGSIKK